jgi:hypothetical protein
MLSKRKKTAQTLDDSKGNPLPAVYDSFLQDLKDRIRMAQLRAALSVNRELVLLYWSVGRDILTWQENEGWGAKIIDRLSDDLTKAFPEMRGFRARNLKYMRAFAEAYPDKEFVQQVVAQLPWGHQVAYGLTRSPNPALDKPKGSSVTQLKFGVVLPQQFHPVHGLVFCSTQNRSICVDMAETTLYLVARLLVTFPWGASKGNPVRIRNCPAAVSRIEHPIPLVFSETGKMGK